MKAWQAAKRAVTDTMSRHLADGGGPATDERIALDSYLRDFALGVKKRGWTLDARKCVFCAARSGLRTGTLPYVGPVLFCPRCEDHYRLLRGEDAQEQLRIHYRDDDGGSLCGIGTRTTPRKSDVTCLRCQSYLRNNSSLRRLVADILG